MEKILKTIDEGKGSMSDIDLLWDIQRKIEGNTICPLGDAAAWLAALGIVPAWTSGSLFLEAVLRIAVLLFIALALPNTLEILGRYEPALGYRPPKNPAWLQQRLAWQPNSAWAVGLAGISLAGLLSLGQLSEFLYWQF